MTFGMKVSKVLQLNEWGKSLNIFQNLSQGNIRENANVRKSTSPPRPLDRISSECLSETIRKKKDGKSITASDGGARRLTRTISVLRSSCEHCDMWEKNRSCVNVIHCLADSGWSISGLLFCLSCYSAFV